MNGSDIWVFGYGSLVFRPGFSFVERRAASVLGWARRFWQGSLDHRGVPGAPGRVVTLVAAPGERCRGVAYRLPRDGAVEILQELDHREKGGYVRERVSVHFDGGGAVEAVTWIADPARPEYLGPAEDAAIALQVRESVGPSGRNDEYVMQLAAALRDLGAEDEHVFGIESLVRTTPAG